MGKTAYFEEKGAFDLYKIVMGNPLLLMLGVGGILTVSPLELGIRVGRC